MTRDDEPRLCIHCGNRIARTENGDWCYAVWVERGFHGIGMTCPKWQPGHLREPMDTEHEGRHFPGILIADMEAVDIEDWDGLETHDLRGGV